MQTFLEFYNTNIYNNQNIELEYNLFLEYCDNLLNEKISIIPQKLKKNIDFIKDLANRTKIDFLELIQFFKNSIIFKFFSLIGWSIKKLYKLVKQGFKLYGDIQRIIADYIAKSAIGEWTDEKLIKLQKFLQTHPKLNKLTGITIAGLLIYIWYNMTFTGDYEYDFDLSNVILALTGNYDIYDIFGGTEGKRLLLLFVTGALLGVSFPWPAPQHALFLSSIVKSIINVKKQNK